jgi:DNA-binding GntR family transcriptional regulator
MAPQFEPLEQKTTPEGVYRVLRDAILNGALPAGGQLREAHIAADMGISRAPLREALTRLEEEGLVVKVPFRGAFVTEVSAETIAEIASVRFLVEPYAAELSAETLRGPQKARLNQTIKALKQATRKKDIAGSIDAHLQFHRLFYEFSNHAILLDLWNGWESKLRLFLAADHRSFLDLSEIATAHEKLAEMVLSGDMDPFRHELAHHVHSAPGESLEDDANAPALAHDTTAPV